MKRETAVYKRKDGRYEARYKAGVNENGRAVYASVYGHSEDEVRAALEQIEAQKAQTRHNELNLLILGAGSHGHDCREIAQQLKVFNKIRFLDDNAEGADIIGTCARAAEFRNEFACAFVAIGDNRRRKKLALFLESQGFRMPNLIAPGAAVSAAAVLGHGIVIMSGATVGEAVIGDHVILEGNSFVGRGSELGAFTRLDCGSSVPKDCRVAEGTWLKNGEVYGGRRA